MMRNHGYRGICLFLTALLFMSLLLPDTIRATFSIVAVDSEAGAVGSAGASCIDDVDRITHLFEGIGGFNCQGYCHPVNAANAESMMLAGKSPDSILAWLIANDYDGDPEIRVYGIVTLAGPGASISFAGSRELYWAGCLYGPGYAIQGGGLLDSTIIYSMRDAFVGTSGSLEEKLMAALEAADVPGADTRCYSCNKSSISAFVKVYHTGDNGNHFLDLVVDHTECSKNPIDSLRILYDSWVNSRYADSILSTVSAVPVILPANNSDTSIITITPRNSAGQPPLFGSSVTISHTGGGTLSEVIDNGNGTFSATMTAPATPGMDTIKVTVTAGGSATALASKPILTYYLCGDINGDGAANIKDITAMINYLYRGGIPPDPPARGDVNGDAIANIKDITYLINFLYRSGPNPICI